MAAAVAHLYRQDFAQRVAELPSDSVPELLQAYGEIFVAARGIRQIEHLEENLAQLVSLAKA